MLLTSNQVAMLLLLSCQRYYTRSTFSVLLALSIPSCLPPFSLQRLPSISLSLFFFPFSFRAFFFFPFINNLPWSPTALPLSPTGASLSYSSTCPTPPSTAVGLSSEISTGRVSFCGCVRHTVSLQQRSRAMAGKRRLGARILGWTRPCSSPCSNPLRYKTWKTRDCTSTPNSARANRNSTIVIERRAHWSHVSPAFVYKKLTIGYVNKTRYIQKAFDTRIVKGSLASAFSTEIIRWTSFLPFTHVRGRSQCEEAVASCI